MFPGRPSPFNAPNLRSDLPTWPEKLQLIRVTDATVQGPSGVAQTAGSSVLAPPLHVAFVQQVRSDGSLLPRDREPCLAAAARGLQLSPGMHLGRLSGSHNSLPVYEIVEIGAPSGGGTDTDELVKVSSNDTTAGYLHGKLVAGSNITLTENNNGGNETLTIAAASFAGMAFQEEDGSPAYTSILTVIVHQADGLVLSQPMAGQVRIDILPAGFSQAGVVSTAAQVIAGSKRFASGTIYIGGAAADTPTSSDTGIAVLPLGGQQLGGGTYIWTQVSALLHASGGGLAGVFYNNDPDHDVYFAVCPYVLAADLIPYAISHEGTLYKGVSGLFSSPSSITTLGGIVIDVQVDDPYDPYDPDNNPPVDASELCRGWVQFDAGSGSVTIRDSYNVAGVTRLAAGSYEIEWATDFANDDYAVTTGCDIESRVGYDTKAAGSVRVKSAPYNSGTLTDVDGISVAAFGDRA